MADDFELLHRWRAGEQRAGQELFARHFDALHRFFRNKVGDDAGDLVQATLLACLERRDEFREESSFRTFLFAVARKRLYSHYESRMRDAGRFDPASQSMADLGVTPTQLLGLKAEHKRLLHALRLLAYEMQELLEMHYWEKLTGPELAAALGVPEGTARTRLRRAKQLLAAKLAELDSGARLETLELDLERWAEEVRQRMSA